MEAESRNDVEAALRPLRMIDGLIAALRARSLPSDEERAAVSQVAGAVDMSLRRLVRDHPAIAMPVRLRALAPEELSADEVLAELRQHDRISMQLAAAVHELFEARRRIKGGAELAPGDSLLACEVADRLEMETASPSAAARPADPIVAAEETVLLPVETDATPSRSRRPLYLATSLAVVALLGAIAYTAIRSNGNDDEMEQGIALFDEGEFADAASHFYRSAQANPEDATPHIYLARIHRRLQRPDLAAPEIERALELEPEDVAAHTELGLLLTDSGDYDQAVTRLREAIRLDPEFSGAWIGLIRALRADGQIEAAERVRETAPAEIRAMLARPS